MTDTIDSYVCGISDAPLLGDIIGRCLDRAAQRWANREALVSPSHDVRWTWKEFAARVDALAAGFLALGLERGARLGVMICEDMWFPDVAETHSESGAEMLIVPNGSPYEHDKSDERLGLAAQRVTETDLPLLYVNQIGGQDELVFDGASFVTDAGGQVVQQLPAWHETVALASFDGAVPRPGSTPGPPGTSRRSARAVGHRLSRATSMRSVFSATSC